MSKLLRYDFYYIFRSKSVAIFLGVLLIVSLWLCSFNYASSKNDIEKMYNSSAYKVIFSDEDLALGFENYWEKVCYQSISAPFHDNQVIMLFVLIFTPYFFYGYLKNGSVCGLLYAGNRRGRLLGAKLISYYTVGCLFSIFTILLSLTISRFGWWKQCSTSIFLTLLLTRILLDIGTLSIAVAVTLIFQKTLTAIIVNLLFLQIPTIVATLASAKGIYAPWAFYADWDIWNTILGTAEEPIKGGLLLPVIVGVIYVAIFSAIAYVAFRKRDFRVER